MRLRGSVKRDGTGKNMLHFVQFLQVVNLHEFINTSVGM